MALEKEREKEKQKQKIIKGSPVKYCTGCGKKKWSCRCYRVTGFEEMRKAKERQEMTSIKKSSILKE